MADIKIRKAKLVIKDKISKAGNPYKSYSLMESYKIKDPNGGDKWVNYFWDAYIKNSEGLNNKAVLENIEASTMGGEYMDRATIKLYVKEFTLAQNGEAPAVQDPNAGFVNVPEGMDSELPFAMPTR